MACQNNNEVFFTPGLFGSGGGAVLVVVRTYRLVRQCRIVQKPQETLVGLRQVSGIF